MRKSKKYQSKAGRSFSPFPISFSFEHSWAALEHHAAQWGDFQYAGLTVSQSRAYITLWKLLDMNPEGISLKTLSRKLHVTPGAASEMVDLLVNKGLVTREQSKSDRRAICINFPEEL